MTIQAVSKEGVTAKIDWVSGKVVPRTFYGSTLGKGLAQNWRRHPMAGTLITRLACAVAVTLLTFVGLATQSTAAPPARPPDNPDRIIYLPAGVACAGFDLRIEFWDAKNRVEKEFTDRNGNVVRLLFAGKGDLLALTNLDSGESLIMRTGGSVSHITVNPDNTQTSVNTGHNVVVFFPTDVPAGPSTKLYVGELVYTVDTFGVFTLERVTGTSTDICAALSD
jgi:hypothetical protein